MSPAGTTSPRFTIEIETQPDRVIAHCHGLLVAGVTEVLQSQVKPLLVPQQRVVLDLTELTRVDSMGLGAILGLALFGQAPGVPVRVAQPGEADPPTHFAISNLLTLFEQAGDNTFRII